MDRPDFEAIEACEDARQLYDVAHELCAYAREQEQRADRAVILQTEQESLYYREMARAERAEKERDEARIAVALTRDQLVNGLRRNEDGTSALLWTQEQIDRAADTAAEWCAMFGLSDTYETGLQQAKRERDEARAERDTLRERLAAVQRQIDCHFTAAYGRFHETHGDLVNDIVDALNAILRANETEGATYEQCVGCGALADEGGVCASSQDGMHHYATRANETEGGAT
jgi:hypothetical protein